MTDEHQSSAGEQERATPEAIHCPERGEDTDELGAVDDAGEQKLHFVCLTECAEETGRVVDQGVDTDKLLEEHDAHAHDCSLPATSAEAITPGSYFELEVASSCAILEVRVSFDVDLLRERDFGADLAPFPVYPRVRCMEATKLGQDVKSFVVAAFAGEPARRER